MTTSDYAFCRGLEYPSIVAMSQRVAWTVDEIFANRRFEATKHIFPDELATFERVGLPDKFCRNWKQRRCAMRSINLCKRSWRGSR